MLTLDFPPLQDGGVARWMDEIARGLAAEGVEVSVLTRGRKAEALAHDAAHPARVLRMPGHSWRRWHRTLLHLYGPFLGAHLAGAALHAATFDVAEAIAPAASRYEAKLLVYVHGLEVIEARKRGTEARYRAAMDAAHAVVANSRRVRDIAVAAGADPAKVKVVLPAIDAARLRPEGPTLRAAWGIGEDAPVILTLARLVARKGQDTVIRAMPEVLARFPTARYVIAGGGPDRARLESLAREVKVEHAVSFAGFVPEADLAAAYRSADVYAMVARETDADVEGFGITYLEAGACAKPVVAGASGGVPDAVEQGVTGLLVDPIAPAAAAGIIALLEDPARRAQLGAAARARVERVHSRSAMIAALRGLV